MKSMSRECRNVRIRRIPRHFDEIDNVDNSIQISPRDNFRGHSYLPVIECLIILINYRLEANQLLCTRFGFLSSILSMSNEELRQPASYLLENVILMIVL